MNKKTSPRYMSPDITRDVTRDSPHAATVDGDLTGELLAVIDRQLELQRQGGSFEERARLQSRIHDLRAALRSGSAAASRRRRASRQRPLSDADRPATVPTPTPRIPVLPRVA